MNSRFPHRVARPLTLLAAFAGLSVAACGGEGEADWTDEGEASALAEDEAALNNLAPPGGGDPLPVFDPSSPQEMPVCQDCQRAGYVSLSSSGGVTYLTLSGRSAGMALNTLAGGSYVPTGDRIYVTQRQLINGTWQDVTVWSADLGVFDHGAWLRAYSKVARAYVTSNNAVLTSTPMPLNTGTIAMATLGTAANWKGSVPNLKATILVQGNAQGGGIWMPVPYIAP